MNYSSIISAYFENSLTVIVQQLLSSNKKNRAEKSLTGFAELK